MDYLTSNILSNQEITKGVYKLVIQGNFQGKPGQFYMLRAWDEEPVLSRPISINDLDSNSITFLYQKTGRGTEILSKLQKGQEVNLQGPMGNSFPVEKLSGNIAIITGGIGIAPMLYVIKNLSNCKVDMYCGFRNKSYIVDEMKNFAQNIYISTEDGSEGHKGYVTDMFKPEKYDAVLCCGPEIMMNKVIKMCSEKDVKLFVSMEKHMACGIGACLVCTCKTKDGNKRTCKDGPVFLGSEVILDA